LALPNWTPRALAAASACFVMRSHTKKAVKSAELVEHTHRLLERDGLFFLEIDSAATSLAPGFQFAESGLIPVGVVARLLKAMWASVGCGAVCARAGASYGRSNSSAVVLNTYLENPLLRSSCPA
jgi:hypothetical protein